MSDYWWGFRDAALLVVIIGAAAPFYWAIFRGAMGYPNWLGWK